ncbi:MAG: hypothetical protein ACKOCM_09815 [Cyanobacteriota bacterium]
MATSTTSPTTSPTTDAPGNGHAIGHSNAIAHSNAMHSGSTDSDDTASSRELSSSSPVNLHQGDTIRLPDDGSIRLPQTSQSEGSLYQVIALDAGHDRCWIRSWPLTRQGSPVFEISLQQAQRHGAHRPVLQRQSP